MITATSVFLRSSCAWTIVSICRIALSLCSRWWVLGRRGVVYATSVDSNSTRLSCLALSALRRSSGGGDAKSSFVSSVASCFECFSICAKGHSQNNLSCLGFREV
ncbi:hypothetical protein EDB84DRAFT_1514821 [Lactarius hengduanensis]|nr:hypothetical protein EDB84DRAFT_1514821 [Lactarius hengduanensis]